jgi:hypothetical protein
LRLATGGAADCRGTGAKPNEDSMQQQLVNKTPAAVPDTFFRNCLRVGMVDSQFFRVRFPFGLSGWAYLYTRGRSEGTVLFYSGLNPSEISALGLVEKLHLVSKKR